MRYNDKRTIFKPLVANKFFMKKNILIIVLALFINSCGQRGGIEIKVKEGTIINNITIISANDEKVDSFLGFVVIEGKKIIYVNKKKPLLSGNFKEINGRGKFIITGLMDSHVHLASTAGLNGKLKNKYPKLVDSYFEQLPRSYLYHGFTTLVDVNNYNPKLVDQIKKSPLHPDIYTCGNQVQVMNDFEMEMEEYSLESRFQSQFLHDKYNKKIVFPDSIDLTKHTPEMLLSTIKNQHGVGVKLVYEDEASGLMVSWAKPTKNIIRDVVFEAKKQNLPVLIHAPSLEGHKVGLESGVEIFAHGMWNWTANFKEEFNNLKLKQKHKEILSKIAQKQLGYQLTFRTITGEEDLIKGNFSSDKNLSHVYPKTLLNILKTEEGDWGRNKILGRGAYLKKTNPSFYNSMRSNYNEDIEMWSSVYKLYKSRLNTVAKFLFKQNANFIFGSDTPAMNMFTNPPGYNGFLEMKHMFDAGISLEKIFRATTYNNAKAFRLEALYGGVEKGKKANLLILKSNPLYNINAYNDIEFVIIGGKLIPREKLSATNTVYN